MFNWRNQKPEVTGTVNIISNNPPVVQWHARFTTVLFTGLTDQGC